MKILKHTLLIFSIISLFNACSSTKYKYLYEEEDFFGNQTDTFTNTKPVYNLSTGDLLYIEIISADDEVSKYFQNNASFSSDVQSIDPDYLSGYQVNDSGNVVLPIIGTIKVDSMTVKQAEYAVQKRIDRYVNHAAVKVRLLGFKIYILGEVSSPGQYSIGKESVNIFEVLAKAGGLTDMADKRKVLIVRATDSGSQTFRVDLSQRSILGSPNLYLQSGDILIVDPLPSKTARLQLADFFTILSTVTTTLTTLLLISNLSK